VSDDSALHLLFEGLNKIKNIANVRELCDQETLEKIRAEERAYGHPVNQANDV
jgi:hypothetical protein